MSDNVETWAPNYHCKAADIARYSEGISVDSGTTLNGDEPLPADVS